MIVFIVALCLAVAVAVIAFIPHSSVPTVLPAKDVPGLDQVSGLAAGVTVDPGGTIAVKIAEPSAANGCCTSSSCCPAWPWSH